MAEPLDPLDPQSPETPLIRHRREPTGSWPRNTKMWVMGAVAVVFLLIVLFGSPRPTATPSRTPAVPAPAPTSPQTVRGLQQQFEDQARRVPPPQPVTAGSDASARHNNEARDTQGRGGGDSTGDTLRTERLRRDYESLFASNVVQSATLDTKNPRQPTRTRPESGGPGLGRSSSPPSPTEELAALLRALPSNPPSATQTATSGSPPPSAVAPGPSPRPTAAPPAAQVPDGPLYPVAQGSVIETVLLTRIEGSTASPVNVLVTHPVYAPDHQTVLIPAGAKILGTSQPVQAFGQTRLAVTFQRLQLPNGLSYSLDAFPALSSLGEAGLRDQTDNHLRSVIGASAAVGVISGLSQLVTGGYNRSGGGTVVVAGGAADGTSQATSMVMNRYLSRMPTVTIREGHEVRVYATADLQLPAFRVRVSEAP